MICRIQGKLEGVDNGRAMVTVEGGLTYEVLLPAFLAARLAAAVDQPITLLTLHYLEGTSQGSNFVPRLAGFTEPSDKAFYELFTSVKGIGPRKALRAMTLATPQIAGAIADRDVSMLQSLPEIGKRMAETIVASLHGKVDPFIAASSYGGEAGERESAGASAPSPRRDAAREALEVLLQLGENRVQAVEWIDRVLTRQPDLDDSQSIITEVLRLKSSG